MNDNYAYEPSVKEAVMQRLIGGTLAMPYYRRLVNGLHVKADDRVLDYCAGSGILSRLMARRLTQGQLIYADVSQMWLSHAASKLKRYTHARGEKIHAFRGRIAAGEYDLILVHCALHDFPREYRLLIIAQLTENLKPCGRLCIREPLCSGHGMPLCELINLLEHTHLHYGYKVAKSRIMGDYVDIVATKNRISMAEHAKIKEEVSS